MKSEYVPCTAIAVHEILKYQLKFDKPLPEYLNSLLLDEAFRYLIKTYEMNQDVAYEYCLSLQNGLLD